MIVMKSSENFTWPWSEEDNPEAAEEIFRGEYPSIYTHFKKLQSFKDAKTGE